MCDAYRKCKLGSVKEKDFAKLEDIINYVHDQLLKRRQRNSHLNLGPSKSPLPSNDNDEQKTGYPETQTQANNNNNNNNNKTRASLERPPLNKISSPTCSMCNKSFPSSHCYTTCNHPLCIKCLVQTFNHQPKNPRWYVLFCTFLSIFDPIGNNGNALRFSLFLMFFILYFIIVPIL